MAAQPKPEQEAVQILNPALSGPELEAALDFSGAKRFIKHAEGAGMGITASASLILQPALRYATSGNGRSAGDERKPAKEMVCVSIIAVAPDKTFAAWAHWEDQTLLIAKWGGPIFNPSGPRIFTSSKVTDVYAALNGLKGHWEQ